MINTGLTHPTKLAIQGKPVSWWNMSLFVISIEDINTATTTCSDRIQVINAMDYTKCLYGKQASGHVTMNVGYSGWTAGISEIRLCNIHLSTSLSMSVYDCVVGVRVQCSITGIEIYRFEWGINGKWQPRHCHLISKCGYFGQSTRMA